MKTKIISICMAKGGVGKSVSAINLSAALARTGKKVLLLDLDSQQGNATLALGHNPIALKYTIANIISHYLDTGEIEVPNECILKISDHLDLIPANPKLAGIQNRLIIEKSNKGILEDDSIVSSERVINEILNTLKEDYQYIIIDCSPSISMLTINALVSSDSVILPIEAHYEGYESLKQILDVVARIKVNLNPKLEIEGVLITKYQSRTKLCRDMKEYTEKNFGEKLNIFSEPVPYSIRAAELAGLGVSIFEHDPNSELASSYVTLAREVLENGVE